MMMRTLSLAAAAYALTLTAAFAHHGWDGYQDMQSEIAGTVQAVSLAGSHASVKLRGDDGRTWNVLLSPPYAAFAAGIRNNTIPVGAMIVAHGHRHRDESKLEIKAEEITIGERIVKVYPGRS
jgi:hypothetical protein